jgi:hypothetical protein
MVRAAGADKNQIGSVGCQGENPDDGENEDWVGPTGITTRGTRAYGPLYRRPLTYSSGAIPAQPSNGPFATVLRRFS